MTPPEGLGSNLWRLLADESVSGNGGTIKGPKVVRVHEFETDPPMIQIQAGDQIIEVEGDNFEAVVTKETK